MFNKKFFNLPGEIATGYYTIISFHKQTCLLSMGLCACAAISMGFVHNDDFCVVNCWRWFFFTSEASLSFHGLAFVEFFLPSSASVAQLVSQSCR
ncbi:hypothetical protein T08_2215 [Trichinella sp. T8]|nr:hypothetical protein T08_2215 [Trichinella sp. T8]